MIRIPAFSIADARLLNCPFMNAEGGGYSVEDPITHIIFLNDFTLQTLQTKFTIILANMTGERYKIK